MSIERYKLDGKDTFGPGRFTVTFESDCIVNDQPTEAGTTFFFDGGITVKLPPINITELGEPQAEPYKGAS